MHDQADELRQLVLRETSAIVPAGASSPRLIVVASGKGGAGATTVAIHLAMSLAHRGRPTLLVDADLHSANATAKCHLEPNHSIADVLSGKKSIHEVLERGPGGIQVLPGAWGDCVSCLPTAQDRFIGQLRQFAPHAEFVVLDVGRGFDRVVRRFWQTADTILAVTTAEAVSVLDTYAAIKVLIGACPLADVRSVVNFAPDQDVAADVHGRLQRACRRFLGIDVTSSGYLGVDPALGAFDARSLLSQAPRSAVAQRFDALTADLLKVRPWKEAPSATSSLRAMPWEHARQTDAA